MSSLQKPIQFIGVVGKEFSYTATAGQTTNSEISSKDIIGDYDAQTVIKVATVSSWVEDNATAPSEVCNLTMRAGKHFDFGPFEVEQAASKDWLTGSRKKPALESGDVIKVAVENPSGNTQTHTVKIDVEFYRYKVVSN